MSLRASDPRWAGYSAKTAYFGGGTPSLHTPDEIARILGYIAQSWPLERDAEITLEANPGTVNNHYFERLYGTGVNRLSLGAQSFSQRKLDLLYRDHSIQDIYDAFRAARDAGFRNISLDLIFGLPDETLDEWKHDLESALALEPEHVSLYNLEFHEGTPYFRWRESGRLAALSEDLEAEMYLFTSEFLTSHGYEHYEVSNFARTGFRARHNSAYWERKPYLGFGPSAHSFDGVSRRWYNVADVHEYGRAIESGQIPVRGEIEIAGRERIEEWISLALRRSEGIERRIAQAELGNVQANELWNRARELPGGSSELSEDRLILTPTGWFKENSVLLFLFEGLNT